MDDMIPGMPTELLTTSPHDSWGDASQQGIYYAIKANGYFKLTHLPQSFIFRMVTEPEKFPGIWAIRRGNVIFNLQIARTCPHFNPWRYWK